MARKFANKPRKMEEAEMDITPMIDCTFLLLIFFLVTSKMDASATLRLPPAKHGAAAVEINSVILFVAKSADGGAIPYYNDELGNRKAFDVGDPLRQEEEIREYVGREFSKPTAKDDPIRKSAVIIKAEMGIKHREIVRIAKAASVLPGLNEEVEVKMLYVAVQDNQ